MILIIGIRGEGGGVYFSSYGLLDLMVWPDCKIKCVGHNGEREETPYTWVLISILDLSYGFQDD